VEAPPRATQNNDKSSTQLLPKFAILSISIIMRPILLKGHERSITVVKFNYDGDLLFTASKDHVPSVWRTETGERVGTYNGHKGTIWDLDIDRFSRLLLTASADATAKLWDCQTGEILSTYEHKGPVRGVAWAEGGQYFCTISDPFVDHNAQISIFKIKTPEEEEKQGDSEYDDDDDLYWTTPIVSIDLPKTAEGKRINPTNVAWTAMNEHVFVTFDNGAVRLYDPEYGDVLEEFFPHDKKINRVSFNRDKTLFITSSADFTAKLYDAINFTPLKTYKTDRPVNDAVISETKDHILLGGGQEAMSVTTTAGKVGKFETRFFHMIYEDEFGIVKGHFGPINALDIAPHGRCYASGAEDGYVRLHFFDKNYLDMKDPVPEEEDGEEELGEGIQDGDIEEEKEGGKVTARGIKGTESKIPTGRKVFYDEAEDGDE
jgi:translation initiation factor 3 subunit I